MFIKNWLHSLFLLGSLAMTLFSSNTLFAAERPWTLRTTDEGVFVSTRKVDGSAMLEFKGNVIVDAPLAKIIPFFEDVKNLPRFYHQCISSELIEDQGEQDKIVYIVLHLPWPVAQRDAIFKRSKSLDTNSGIISYSVEALPERLPAKKGKIRVLAIDAIWRFTPLPNGKTEIYFQQHTNPGGSIPAFMVNQLVVDIPFNTLKNFRRLVNEKS